ncbi:transposase [Xanthomonas oryzae]|uniref:transposase n=14 Tax=Xanthomonas oryzae TaxID=347 RepID=UPI00215BEB16|nr:transposase [Xanthomonas oryzae]
MLNRTLEVRFEQYGEVVAAALSHADRKQPAHWYLKGLLLPGGRKSVEPMAARVHPQNVRSAHQSMHHLMADADWSDQALLAAVAAQVLPTLNSKSAACHWIVDDTGFSKKGVHSVDVPPSLSSTLVWSPIPYPEEIGREEALFRRADHRLPARSRGRHADQRPVPTAWLQ